MDATEVMETRRSTEILPGRIYEFGGERIEVCTIIDNSECIVQKFGTRERFPLTVKELKEGAYQPKTIDDLGSVSKARWDRANDVRKVIQKLDAEGDTTDEKLTAAGIALTPQLGLRQIREYLARFRANPSTFSCVRLRPGRPRKEKRLNARVEELIGKSATEAIESEEGTSLDQIWTRAKTLCEEEKLPTPSKDTVARRLLERGISLRLRRRVGPAKYRESMTPLMGNHVVAYPGAEYQIDHTLIDLMALDESRKFCLGRFWMTLVMDVFSRCILGFFLSFLPPSMASVQRALSLAVSNKSRALGIWGFDDFEWPMQGIPKTILTDHGREFKADAYLRGCEQHGITPKWRLVKSWGGHIERLIGRMMGRLHLLPGTTFSNVPKRIGYHPETRAVMTGSEILRFIVSSMCEYHETRHSVLGVTPRMRWEEGQSLVPAGVLHTPSMPKFYHDFLPEYCSGRQRDGIHWGGYTFNSRVLAPIPVRQKVTYRVDHWDTSRALVRMPDGTFVEVPRITPVTYNQHALERQLRAARGAGCFAADIVGRREAAAKKGRAIITDAKVHTAAVRQQQLAIDVTPLVTLKPPSAPTADIVGTASIVMPTKRFERAGAFVRPSTIFTTSRL